MIPLTKKQQELLRQINRLYKKQPVFPPIPADFTQTADHKLVLARLYKLEADCWIQIYRARGKIRAIVPLARV